MPIELMWIATSTSIDGSNTSVNKIALNCKICLFLLLDIILVAIRSCNNSYLSSSVSR